MRALTELRCRDRCQGRHDWEQTKGREGGPRAHTRMGLLGSVLSILHSSHRPSISFYMGDSFLFLSSPSYSSNVYSKTERRTEETELLRVKTQKQPQQAKKERSNSSRYSHLSPLISAHEKNGGGAGEDAHKGSSRPERPCLPKTFFAAKILGPSLNVQMGSFENKTNRMMLKFLSIAGNKWSGGALASIYMDRISWLLF